MTDRLKLITLQSALSDVLCSHKIRSAMSLGEIARLTSDLADTLGVTPEELDAENLRIAAKRNWTGTRMPNVDEP